MNDAPARATVILFKPSGKYYTEQTWRIPTLEEAQKCEGFLPGDMVLPYVMRHSPDFRRVSGKGAVLIPTQEPWGYPHLIPAITDEDPAEITRLTQKIRNEHVAMLRNVAARQDADGAPERADDLRWAARLVESPHLADADRPDEEDEDAAP